MNGVECGRQGHVEPAQRIWLPDEAATLDFARRCAGFMAKGGLIFLEGDLGAGKTTFARGVLRAFGYTGPVKSPTYTLVEPYLLPEREIYHCDLYRLADPEELEYLGLREEFDPGSIVLIEWAERGRGWLPEPDLRISLELAGGTGAEDGESVPGPLHGRYAVLEPATRRAEHWLDNLHN